VTGNNQNATVGTSVVTAPQVVVRDQFNNLVQGASVTFAVTGGGGSVVPTTAVSTAADGTASATSWTLGTGAGTNNNTLTATVPGGGTVTGNPVTFTASGLVGTAAILTVAAGDGQSATVNTAVSTPPQVRVTDQYGNPVAGHPVTFAVTGGGGVVAPTTAITTNAAGLATVTSWTLGTSAGTSNNTLSATAGGSVTTGNPTTFTASATAGAPASVQLSGAGNNQTATVNTAVATAPQVLVRDQFNNLVQGASVTFAVTAGGGAVVPTTAVSTNASGLATATSWTLGTSAGTSNNTLTATVAGGGITGNPVTFTASATAGSPASVVLSAGNNQSATVNSAVATSPRVLVRDAFNNPVQGASVTFAVTGGGGSVLPTTAISTDASGQAAVTSWTLGTAAGTNNNTLSATVTGSGITNNPITFTASATAGAAASIAISLGNNQSATVNTAVATDPQVIVRDQFNNPVSGHSVTFQVLSGGGAVVPTTAITTNASGLATVTSWTLGTSAGTNNNTLRAQAAGSGISNNPVTFTASATAGAPASVAVSLGNNQSAIVNTAVATDPQVLVRDAFNNPVPGASVNFAVTGGGGSVTGGSQTTNGSGLATVTSWTLGTSAGTNNNTLSATVTGSGIANNPITFTASANPGAAASIVTSLGNGQTATIGTAVATAPRVLVRDAFLNAVPNATVIFAVTGGGGSATGTSQVTNSSGLATVGSWTLSNSATMSTTGTYSNTLSATVQGTAISTSFTGSARYSWTTHVNPIISTSTCTGCHVGAGTSGLALDGVAATNYSALVNVTMTCDDPTNNLDALSYRRVSTSTGTTGRDRSFLWRFMQAYPADSLSTCGPHSTKTTAGETTILEAWIRNGAPNN